MKNNPNHGNRLRPPEEAYEAKKKRSRDRYAEAQLKINPFWLHNKILRDLVNLNRTGTEIPISEFEKRKFDPTIFKSETKKDGTNYLNYDKYCISITKQKTIIIWEI